MRNPLAAGAAERAQIRADITAAAHRVRDAATWQTVTLVVVALVAVVALGVAVAAVRKAPAE